MPIRREFIDWRLPALAAATEFLRGRFQRDRDLDLSGVIVVLPGSRAGRRLLEILVTVCDQQALNLTPPKIVTPEGFPELLYQAKWPFADVLTQQLAWTEALRSAPPDALAAFLPHPPAPDDTSRWLAVGETLRRLHVELAADGLDCKQVLKGAAALDGFTEHDRWQTLCELQRGYLTILDRLELWDVQTARLVAIKQREIATDKQIVLIGAADLNRAQRQMLDQIADRVTALVIAPPELADRFDPHGCLVPPKWTESELPITDGQIDQVDGPADQAEAVTRWLASLNGQYRADQITIGLADDRLASQIERQLSQCGLSGRWVIGQQLVQTLPCRLLKVAADYAARERFRDLTALVRHPDVYEWVTSPASGVREHPGSAPFAQAQTNQEAYASRSPRNVLTVLDEFASDRFPAQLNAERLAKDEEAADVLAIHAAAGRLVQPLIGKPKPLAEWAQALREILTTIYGARPLNRHDEADRYLLMALEHLRTALDGLARVPAELQPIVDARQTCRIVLAALAGEGLPPPADPERIELLGWLDLLLDDAPAAIVTTFNEGFVPSATTADAFLPNRVRESLGLLDNDRRLARDAYALSLLAASRQKLKLIVARRDSQGNPLAPSRLLFLAEPDCAVARARKFFGPLPPQPPRRNLLHSQNAPSRSKLDVPRPQRLPQPITELSVTKFRDYIACPYRFYLRHMQSLEGLSDDAPELDGGAFGDLAHLVLEQFGRADDAKDVRLATDPKKVADYLDYQLDRIAAARFGKQHAKAAVLVQVEQIRLRLHAFAQWQAVRTREGWRIVFGEDSQSERKLKADFPVDGQPFTLSGRIDRIDFHEQLGKLCVIDYKTADQGEHPDQKHRQRDEWIDLQLPLYRHLVRAAKLAGRPPADAPIQLGYVLLPLDLKSVNLYLAEWDNDLLKTADAKAQQIIRAIREEQFWPRTIPPPDFFDDVAVICQDRSMRAAELAQDEEAA